MILFCTLQRFPNCKQSSLKPKVALESQNLELVLQDGSVDEDSVFPVLGVYAENNSSESDFDMMRLTYFIFLNIFEHVISYCLNYMYRYIFGLNIGIFSNVLIRKLHRHELCLT